jgi:RNA polymerase sigma-70 factor, ECF subfamily
MGTVLLVRPARERTIPAGDSRLVDADSQAWLRPLRARGEERDVAIARLHELLLKAARFEVGRRRASLPHLRGGDFDDLAHQAADDALVGVLRRLDDFRGESRFTTWAYKFALLEAAVKIRKRAWQGRELPLDDAAWEAFASTSGPEEDAVRAALVHALKNGINEVLTPHQRLVLVALALNDVPIDVLADRLDTTRGALYKTLHDARRRLRRYLDEEDL